jgi:YHS domain-containing protein
MRVTEFLSRMMAIGAVVSTVAWAAEVKEDAAKPDNYPLDTCVVSGQKLGAMGEAVKYDHKGREVRFCCQGCIAKFNKDPEKYLAKLDQAAAAKSQAGAGETATPAADPAGHCQRQEGKAAGGCGGCGQKSGGCGQKGGDSGQKGGCSR